MQDKTQIQLSLPQTPTFEAYLPKCKRRCRKRRRNTKGSIDIRTGDQHAQVEEAPSPLHLRSPTARAIPYANSHPALPERPQIQPGYSYPFSLAPSEFPRTFYKLHRDDNWRDLSSPSICANASGHGSSVALQGMEDSHVLDMRGTEPEARYHPLEHGWSAKNTQTPLPFSAKGILGVVRAHFRERGASSSSIFVPGVWSAMRFSGISLWENEEDAVDEGRRFGGGGEDVEVYAVDGDLLRRGGTVVFCMEELLGRDSGLCKAIKGRYGEGREKKGSGLKGRAYLVVGVIPGTHNILQASPVTATKKKIDPVRVKNERESVLGAQPAQGLSSPLTCNRIQRNSSAIECETPEQQASDTDTLQEQSGPSAKITPISTERTSERPLFDWDLNTAMDPRWFERKRSMQAMRQGHQDSAVTGVEETGEDSNMTKRDIREVRRGQRRSIPVVMEAISEDVSVDPHTIHSKSTKASPTPKKSSEVLQGQYQDRSAQRIASSAKITRKGTFGTAPLREDIFVSPEPSSPAQPSPNLNMNPGRSGMRGSQNAGPSTSASRDGYSSEDSLSAGSDIPAIAKPKPHHPTAKDSNSGLPTPRRPKKFQKTLGGTKVAGDWDAVGARGKSTDAIVDYGRTRQPVRTTSSQARLEKMAKETDVVKSKASIDMVPEEWPLKNDEPFANFGTLAVQSKDGGKGIVAETLLPMERHSPLDRTEPAPGPQGRKTRKPESKPVLKCTDEEKAWSYEGVVAAGLRDYDGEFKQSYLVEWKGDWAPTWQQKRGTEGPMAAEWEQKCKFWKAQSRTGAGKKLAREKKIERILFDEMPKGECFLVQYTSDLRPEWVKRSRVDDGIMREFLERKKTWRYWGGGLGAGGSKDDEDEEEEEEGESSPTEVENEDGDLASDEQEWTEA
ncbi:hypothetical protein EYC84_001452 [Monilinia fructicola]|uniref:Chromo domain-containing protein n=1 Tax=Monilinia fructicola TaxID=38448 RepID=A0A5M9JUK8_MONFR|nr:hypothetical protein EYC84_001452 [Monilinia fructicola]